MAADRFGQDRHAGLLLAARGVNGAQAFPFMTARVTSGDKENLEAQAARRYWPLLMGADFRRDRDAAGANAMLNYGYAVMRATCARAVVAAGLHPSIGIQHSNRGNAFALADDLVEPFRPLVDAVVDQMLRAGVTTLDPTVKRRFARLIAFDLRIAGEASPVSVAAQRLARSLARAFEIGKPELALFDPPSPMEWAVAGAPDLDSARAPTTHEPTRRPSSERISTDVDLRHVRPPRRHQETDARGDQVQRIPSERGIRDESVLGVCSFLQRYGRLRSPIKANRNELA